MTTNRPRATVLVVDDTPENLLVLGALLQSSYVVRAANSGERALEVASSAPKPDLILLDVMMPEMDGYECLRRLRANPQTQDIPVIFVTALNAAEDEQRGLELGAVDYITKPVRPAIVLARVHNHLDMKRARDWLRNQNHVLEAELNRFLEILAHHLQEPVRRQFTFAQMLQRALPKPLNDSAEVSLAQIMDGATRLRAMLHDVLLYLSVHQLPPPSAPCSAIEAFSAACAQVSDKIVASGAEVNQGALPPVWIAKDQLTDVFRALLDNALDYCRPDRPPRLWVAGETKDGEVVLSLTDNGIGIPAEYRERLFQIFERLHGDDNRSGTGIGLALVRKIVETAKGRAWIEDGHDGGARICFALPAARPAP